MNPPLHPSQEGNGQPKTIEPTAVLTASDAAKSRILSVRGDPFLFADWERILFLNFTIEPSKLRPHVPPPFEMELRDARACLSLAAVTMRRFRPCRRGQLIAWPFRLLRAQRFLNVRAYVRCRDEPGVLFLFGFLSQPGLVPWPSEFFGLPFDFAQLTFDHNQTTGECRGLGTCRKLPGRFAYHARFDPRAPYEPCPGCSLDEFALERYTGFFCRKRDRYVFRAWHPPWRQTPVDVRLEDMSMIEAAFPWFADAKLVGANYAPGFERVWLGQAHRLTDQLPPGRKSLSTFFELP